MFVILEKRVLGKGKLSFQDSLGAVAERSLSVPHRIWFQYWVDEEGGKKS